MGVCDGTEQASIIIPYCTKTLLPLNHIIIFIFPYQQLAKSHRGSPVEFIWAQGGDHYELEEAFTLGSGYPALVAVSVNKERYAPFRGAFNKKGIDSFIKSIQNGKEPLFPLPNGFTSKINKVKAWDGKDAAPSTSTDDDL